MEDLQGLAAGRAGRLPRRVWINARPGKRPPGRRLVRPPGVGQRISRGSSVGRGNPWRANRIGVGPNRKLRFGCRESLSDVGRANYRGLGVGRMLLEAV